MTLRMTEERKRLGFKSQSSFARRTGIHTTSISQIETGHLYPYPGQMKKIAEALDWKDDPRSLFEEVR